MKYSDKKMLPSQAVSLLSEEEKLFCLMVFVLGYTATQAYRLAISPNVTVSSASSMGCRLMQEPRIQCYIRTLDRMSSKFTLNYRAIKAQ